VKLEEIQRQVKTLGIATKEDLARLDVRHDQLFVESSLYAGWDQDTMTKLATLGRIAKYDGATWFKSDTGKDEVVIKRDGYPTYFWSDILYHRDKFEKRGFNRVVDVQVHRFDARDEDGNQAGIQLRALFSVPADLAVELLDTRAFLRDRHGAVEHSGQFFVSHPDLRQASPSRG